MKKLLELLNRAVAPANIGKGTKDQTAQELINGKISFVSYVTDGANRREFAIIKSLDGKTPANDIMEKFAELAKFAEKIGLSVVELEPDNKEQDSQSEYQTVIKLRKSIDEQIGSFKGTVVPDYLVEMSKELAEKEVLLASKLNIKKNNEDGNMNPKTAELLKGIIEGQDAIQKRLDSLEKTNPDGGQSTSSAEPEGIAESIEKEDEDAIHKAFDVSETVSLSTEDINADVEESSKSEIEADDEDKRLSYKEYVRHAPSGSKVMDKKSFSNFMVAQNNKGNVVVRDESGRPTYNKNGRPKMAKRKIKKSQDTSKMDNTNITEQMSSFAKENILPMMDQLAKGQEAMQKSINDQGVVITALALKFDESGVTAQADKVAKARQAGNGNPAPIEKGNGNDLGYPTDPSTQDFWSSAHYVPGEY